MYRHFCMVNLCSQLISGQGLYGRDPYYLKLYCIFCFFFQAEDGIRDRCVTGVQTCALPIFGLGGGPGEAVEHRALLRLGLRELFLDQGEDDRVGDELAIVHELLGLATERCSRRDRGAEDVACRDLRQAEPLREDLALRALPRARRA